MKEISSWTRTRKKEANTAAAKAVCMQGTMEQINPLSAPHETVVVGPGSLESWQHMISRLQCRRSILNASMREFSAATDALHKAQRTVQSLARLGKYSLRVWISQEHSAKRRLRTATKTLRNARKEERTTVEEVCIC